MPTPIPKNRYKKLWFIIIVMYCVIVGALLTWTLSLSLSSTESIKNIEVGTNNIDLIIQGENLSESVTATITPCIQNPLATISSRFTWGRVVNIAVHDHYAWMVDGANGLICYNLTDPAEPVLESVLPLADNAFKLAIEGDKLFLAAGNAGLYCVDISKPSSPLLVFEESTNKIVLDVATTGNLTIITTYKNGITFLDTSNIYHPTTILDSHVEGNLQSVAIYKNNVYVAGKKDKDGILYVFDISDFQHPQLKETLTLPDTAWECVVSGQQLMLALGKNGVYACDISEPSKPTPAVKTAVRNNAFGLAAHKNSLFIASSSDHIYQYRNIKGKLNYEATLITQGQCRSITTHDGLLMAAQGKYGFTILDPEVRAISRTCDVELPAIHYRNTKIYTHKNKICVCSDTIMHLLQQEPDGTIRLFDSVTFDYAIQTIVMDETHVWVATKGKKLHTISLEPKRGKRKQCVLDLPQKIKHINKSGNHLYTHLSNIGLIDIDIRALCKPRINTPLLTNKASTFAKRVGDTLYVTEIPNRLKIYSLDPQGDITLRGTLDYSTPMQQTSPANEFILSGHYLLMTNGSHGILSIDIRDPKEPKLIDSLALGGFCNNITSEQDIACVTTNYNRVKLVNISDPTHLIQLCEIPATKSVALMGKKLLRMTDKGIEVLPIPQPLNVVKQQRKKIRATLPQAEPGSYDLQIATTNELLRYSGLLSVDKENKWRITRPVIVNDRDEI